MDEPKAALSPQLQLSFLTLLHDFVKGNDNIQFIIATHSPILLAYRFFLSLRKKFSKLTTVKASLFNWSADSSPLLSVI
jgi:predicted ATPase